MENINNYARENYALKVHKMERIYDKVHSDKSIHTQKKNKKKENDTYETRTKHLIDVRA